MKLLLSQVFLAPNKKVFLVSGVTPDGVCFSQVNPDKTIGDIQPVPTKEIDTVVGKESERKILALPSGAEIINRGTNWTYKLNGAEESAPESTHHQCLANLLVETEQVPTV